jgi:hypothetical protein
VIDEQRAIAGVSFRVIAAALARCLVATALLLASWRLCVLPLPAQPGPTGPGPASAGGDSPEFGNPEVAYMFLLHHHKLIEETRALAASGAPQDAERSAATLMKLSVRDFRANRGGRLSLRSMSGQHNGTLVSDYCHPTKR